MQAEATVRLSCSPLSNANLYGQRSEGCTNLHAQGDTDYESISTRLDEHLAPTQAQNIAQKGSTTAPKAKSDLLMCAVSLAMPPAEPESASRSEPVRTIENEWCGRW
eukprot:6203620-Pleurochrysis_carterae.AAC.5